MHKIISGILLYTYFCYLFTATYTLAEQKIKT